MEGWLTEKQLKKRREEDEMDEPGTDEGSTQQMFNTETH